MGASESTKNDRQRPAGAQQENKESEGASDYFKAFAAAMVAGLTVVLTGGSGAQQDDKENEKAGVFTEAIVAATMVGSAVVLIGGVVDFLSKFFTERNEAFMISWKAPTKGWMKLNTDGAVKPGVTAAAGLIRDFKGQWIKGFTYNIGHETTPTTAELLGLLMGIQLAWKEGYKKIILETDNEGVVHMINRTRNRQNYDCSLVRKIKLWRERDWEVKVKFCRRNGNRCADWLANYGTKGPVGYRELTHPPEGLVSRLEQDSEVEARPWRVVVLLLFIVGVICYHSELFGD